MKPGTPSFISTRLLDRLRERIRHLHYSLPTEWACLYWLGFITHKWDRSRLMQHAREMGRPAINGFLNLLANQRPIRRLPTT